MKTIILAFWVILFAGTYYPAGSVTKSRYLSTTTVQNGLGSLTVILDPNQVRTEARWQLTTGPDTSWKQSGDTINDITPGDYTLGFNDISGWKRPEERIITISEGSNSQSGTYYEYVYFVDPNLQAAVEEELGFTDPTTNDMLLLTYLYAWNRGITDLTGLGCAINLTELWLNDNQLSSLPSEIGNLKSLTELYLDGNQLSSLPPEIGNLPNLTKLWLIVNQLSSLPPEIGNLTSLTFLYLDGNQLSSLPPEIGNLTRLTELWLIENQLSSLPPEIGNLTSLTKLWLIENQLSSLPPEIGNLTNLTELWLIENQLNSLPSEIGNLTSLTELWLIENQLNSLPSEIVNLNYLTTLDLRSNPLNTMAYCMVLPLIEADNPGIDLRYDPNPNPLTNDCSTDLSELMVFVSQWLETDCGITNNFCSGADLNHFDDVNISDFGEFSSLFLAEPNP